jgi:hypothetical protein
MAGLLGLAAAAAYGQSARSKREQRAAASEPAVAAMPIPKLTVSPPSSIRLPQSFYPLDQVHRGLHGTAYTVFEGTQPEPMEVEILGVLRDAIGPGQDMILGQLHGTKPEYTGVVAGMSGSPVYIDGKLAGALSYRIGQFAKDPICGITPIAQMLEVRDAAERLPLPRQVAQLGGQGSMRGAESSGSAPRSAVAAMPDAAAGGLQRLSELTPIATPLFFGGFSPAAVERFGESFRAMGLEPVAGLAGSGFDREQTAGGHTGGISPKMEETGVPGAGLVPGSAVSAVLVRGDLSMAATCTVTYIDAHQLMACGHPLNQYGPVSMPMTATDVVTTLASPSNSFKIVNTGATIGSFTEDRASAILGRFGVAARMIPVTVSVGSLAGRTRVLHFEVLNNRQMTPQSMLVSVFQSLTGTNAAQSEISYRLRGTLRIHGQQPVKIEELAAPTEFNTAAATAALLVNDRFSRVYDNTEQQPEIDGLEITAEALPGRQAATIEQASLNRSEASPGEALELTVTLQPYLGPERVVRLPLIVPASAAPGTMRLIVSDGAVLDRLTGVGSTPAGIFVLTNAVKRPESLEDTISGMNRVRANDRIYAAWLEHAPQAVVDGAALTGVPLSVANMLEPLRATHGVEMNSESVLEAASLDAHAALSGQQVLTITVR